MIPYAIVRKYVGRCLPFMLSISLCTCVRSLDRTENQTLTRRGVVSSSNIDDNDDAAGDDQENTPSDSKQLNAKQAHARTSQLKTSQSSAAQRTPVDFSLTPRSGAPLSFAAFQKDLLANPADLDDFIDLGPFPYSIRENISLSISRQESILADAVIAQSGTQAPLIILVHGNHSRKEAHRYQAEHIASYGMHALVLQLPNHSQWMQNGQRIARLVNRLQLSPRLLSPAIDRRSIVLVGHSFGGSAVAMAAGRGAQIKGLVLLDPAVVSCKVRNYLEQIKQPVMLLGADKQVFRSRERALFYRAIPSNMAEVSIRGATHDDAQYPSMFSLSAFGFDPYTSPDRQSLFAASLTISAFSLSTRGSLDYAWQSLRDEARGGSLKSAKRRKSLKP